MFSTVIEFANLLMGALTIGVVFGVWLVFNPAGLDASAYIVLQRQGIKTLNKTVPVLALVTLVLTIAAALIARDRARITLLGGAAVCLLAGGLITRFVNQPINATMMTWNQGSLPADWTALRDRWWRWHILRLIAGLGGLSLLIAATLCREWQR